MLVIITASTDDASKVYVKKKIEKGTELGYEVKHIDCTRTTYWRIGDELLAVKDAIVTSNVEKNVDGILLQLPLDESIKEYTQELIDMINPSKDVDCLTTYNQGKIMLGDNSYLPCTTQAVLDMIIKNAGDLNGKIIHVVGRSTLVTKPLIVALINAGASVKTWNSNFDKDEIESAVITELNSGKNVHFVTGIGKAEYFNFSKIKWFNGYELRNKLYLYDIGMNRDQNGKLCGDVKRDLDVKYQSPVPGGIGPKTVDNVYKNLQKLIDQHVNKLKS